MLILRVQHFLKVLLPGSWRSVLSTLFSSDPGFDAYSFKALQLQAIAIHTAGAFFLLLSVCIKDFYFNNFSWDLYFWVIICILGSFITFSGKSALWIFCGGFFVTIASTMGFGLLTRIAVNPFIWFLPLGLIFTIFPISLHQRISHYFFTTLLSWAIFYKVIDPHFDNEIESIFAGLVILGTMLVGFMTVSIFLIIRKKNYEFEIQLHKMANVDVLTNLPNRRAFMTGLDWAIKSESSRGFLFFMMLDIDDFKKINDKFGHDVGDLALKEVAKVIKKHAEEHYFGRLGGGGVCRCCTYG